MKTYISKTSPVSLCLFEAGLKWSESKSTATWGQKPCRVLFVPSATQLPARVYYGAMRKYAEAWRLKCGVEVDRNASVAELRRYLKGAEMDKCKAILVTFKAPRRFDTFNPPPILSVRGCSNQEGNYVYEATEVSALTSLPADLEIPAGISRTHIKDERIEAEVEKLACKVAPPQDELKEALLHITLDEYQAPANIDTASPSRGEKRRKKQQPTSQSEGRKRGRKKREASQEECAETKDAERGCEVDVAASLSSSEVGEGDEERLEVAV